MEANAKLFDHDVWRPALATFGAVTQLTVAIYDTSRTLVCGPTPSTQLFGLFDARQFEPGLVAECAGRCLALTEERLAVVTCASTGLVVVGTSLMLRDRVVGAAVAGYAFGRFAESTGIARLARAAGVPFTELWEVARQQQPVPQHRLRLLGELLQVLGDSMLRENQRARDLLARAAADQETARVRKELLRKDQAARAAIEAGEEERRRISRELHDEIGQEVTALALGLKCARDASPEQAPQLAHLQVMAEQLGRNMHRIAVELRPGALDALGLDAGLANYIEDWSRRHHIEADFAGSGASDRLPGYIEATIYRVVQEALTNIAKHARARTVDITVQRDGADVVTIIEDDGRGFDVAAAMARPGGATLGLLGMSERAALVGGSFTIESQPGGTTVFLRIPLPERAP